MQAFLFFVALCSGAFIALFAHANDRPCCYDENNWYVSGSLMGVLPDDVLLEEQPVIYRNIGYGLDTGFGFSALAGYQLFPNAGLEVEIFGQSSKVGDLYSIVPEGDNNVTRQAIMFNHRWTYRNMGSIAPYLGAGGGVMMIDMGTLKYTDTGTGATESQDIEDAVIAYQFMAGINFAPPSSKMEYFIGYRYIGTQEGEVKYSVLPSPGYIQKFNGDSHNIEFGARMHF